MFEGKTAAYIIAESLRDFSDSFEFISQDAPIQVTLNGEHYSILLNLTHDSGEGRTNPDECRIQLGPSQIRAYKPAYLTGEATLICGYEPEFKVFTIWEKDLVLSRKPSTFSVYSRYSALNEARQFGFSTYEFRSQILQRQSKAINFLTDYFGLVLENFDALFEFDLEALYKARDFYLDTEKETGSNLRDTRSKSQEIEGRRVEVTRLAYARDPKFRQDVMRAYKSKCCVCGIQLALVDAAHIIPHSEEHSDDRVGNGLALCANHHRAYDSGLLVPHEDYVLRLNPERVEFLEESELSDELQQLEQHHDQPIDLPDDPEDHPISENLRIGRHLRIA